MQIVIVTDDLTSATDGAVALAEAGWTVQVTRGSPAESSPAVSIDLATRTLPQGEAVRRVKAVGPLLANAQVIVKQFDSTLRGHVVAETLALLSATGRTRAVVAPAFPLAGRTTVNGLQLVNGVPVSDSEYARDPLNPVTCSDVIALFRAQKASTSLSESDLPEILVQDAATEPELDKIVEKYACQPGVMLAGSTGIVRALARCGPKPRKSASLVRIEPCRHVLVIVGSLNPLSRTQLNSLIDGASVPLFKVSVSDEPIQLANCIAQRFDKETVVAISTPLAPDNPVSLADQLSAVTCELMRLSIVDAIIVTGGDVFGAIVDRLGVTSLEVLQELEPGIPVCKINSSNPVIAISKAGGFGSPDVFLKALAVLSAGSGARSK